MLSAAVPQPCACCNATEFEYLNSEARRSGKAVWEYTFPAPSRCERCATGWYPLLERYGGRIGLSFGISGAICALIGRKTRTRWLGACKILLCLFLAYIFKIRKRRLTIALPEESIALVERSIEAASVAEKGSKYRAHGTFIHHVSGLNGTNTMKMALLSWMPYVIDGWMKCRPGFQRKLLPIGQSHAAPDPIPIDTHSGNPDVEDGKMPGTMLEGNEYGEEDRVQAEVLDVPQPRFLATQIGPDIQPTEVMENSCGNIKAGLAKRVQPLPFEADRKMKTKIRKTVDAILEHVFTKNAILKWREDNPDFSEMASKKWSQDRFESAWDDALSELDHRVKQEFQVKVNEALPAKGKAPRPIIQSGDVGQILMMMPVKCFEDILFHHFEDASIKHCSKYDAMTRVAKRLRQSRAHIVEGDGSAWDSCCNADIRSLTENRVIEHIIRCLCNESQIPKEWMDAMLKDMKKVKIRGKVKMVDFIVGTARATIQAIRQSGHRGTSAFNYFINLICWLCVICEEPWTMIQKQNGELPEWYKSAQDHRWYTLRYSFEGDDSAISSTERLQSERIERLWTSLGFRMKLVFVDGKLTFTGFDFQCDADGPTGVFIPEIPRNISSSSWSCSSLLKMQPNKVHEVGMAAMLARAENFVDYGPLCAYFAALGLAHARHHGDRSIGESEAMHLGINACGSVFERLTYLRDTAGYPDKNMRKLVESVVGVVTHEEIVTCLASFFDDPTDTQSALLQLPRAMWGVAGLSQARR